MGDVDVRVVTSPEVLFFDLVFYYIPFIFVVAINIFR